MNDVKGGIMEKKFKELTEGSFEQLSYRHCFTVTLSDADLTIGLPLKKIRIPKQDIKKLSSDQVKTHIGKAFKVALRLHHSCKDAPEKIHFYATNATNWDAWFTAFERQGIPVEDRENIRHTSTTKLHCAKRIQLFLDTVRKWLQL